MSDDDSRDLLPEPLVRVSIGPRACPHRDMAGRGCQPAGTGARKALDRAWPSGADPRARRVRRTGRRVGLCALSVSGGGRVQAGPRASARRTADVSRWHLPGTAASPDAPTATSLHCKRTSRSILYMAANKKVITRNEIRKVATWSSDSGIVRAEAKNFPMAAIQAFNTRETSSRNPTPKITANE